MARRNPTSQPALFDLHQAVELPRQAAEPGPVEIAGVLLGTSSFTSPGWVGPFYPPGMKSRDYLSYYATRFRTLELDTTFYGTPAVSTVQRWNSQTPPGFLFAAKAPQVITHEKILLNCEGELTEFLETMSALGDKLGPILFQFGKFDKYRFKDQASFVSVLEPFLKKLSGDFRYAVEIRNQRWLNQSLADLLAAYGVALVMSDTSFMPRPWEVEERIDWVTSDFAYVRWLGNRKLMEKKTTTWDKTVEDRTADLKNWVDIFKQMINDKRIRKLFAFANNHYGGYAPATLADFRNLY
jgi:uncharacterized protein YecE (DUF72 family)